MRKNSISEESTRYCNYSKGKFGNGLTFIRPVWYSNEELSNSMIRLWVNNLPDPGAEPIDWYVWSLKNAEIAYLQQVNSGVLPQQARNVLPLSTKTTLVHTAFDSDWQHFIDLRSKGITGAPHPNMKVIADMIKEKL